MKLVSFLHALPAVAVLTSLGITPIFASDCDEEYYGCGSTVCYADVPNMIGDMGLGRRAVLTNNGVAGGYVAAHLTPAGGRLYKAADNNSPTPESRFYYNFGYLSEAQSFQPLAGGAAGPVRGINVRLHEFGAEWAFWNDRVSVQLNLPFRCAANTGLDISGGPDTYDIGSTELGNLSVAFKGLLYRDWQKALSVGVAFDLPTADDVSFIDGNSNLFSVGNDSTTISPFVGWQFLPTGDTFVQGFFQVAIPMGGYQYTVDPAAGFLPVQQFGFDEQTLLNVDVGVGRWLFRTAGNEGLALIAELHYTASLDGSSSVFVPLTNNTFTQDDFASYSATLGATLKLDQWTITLAAIVPLLESPERFADGGFALQINRAF